MKECTSCKKKIKVVVNFIYFVLSIIFIELIYNIPILKVIGTIESGSVLDYFGNLISSIVAFVVLFLITYRLILNAKKYINYDPKKRGARYCSVFNPFC